MMMFDDDTKQAVEAAADDLPGVLGVMKQHLESLASGERVVIIRILPQAYLTDLFLCFCLYTITVFDHMSSPHRQARRG